MPRTVPAAKLLVELDMRNVPRQFAEGIRTAEATVKPIQLRVDSRPLGKISGDLKEFDKSLSASNARVIAFGATTGILYGITAAFASMVSQTINVEKKLEDINVILQTSAANFSRLRTGLFEIAGSTGKSFDEAADAAAEFSRQGLGLEQTLIRTRDSLILSRLAAIDVKDAMADLTAAVNTFGKEALNTTEIVNKLANVDSAFAVSSADLAEAIKRSGSSAADARVSFDKLLATVTSVQQTTARGGPVIGNALKSIFTRVERSSNLETLKALGVAIKDVEGNTRPAIDILEDFAKIYKTLGDTQRAQLSEQLAGIQQINILKALLNDLGRGYSVYSNAVKVSTQTQDEAIRRNEQLNTTTAALLNRTKANIGSLFSGVGSATLEPTLRGILNSFDALFETLKKNFGQVLGADLTPKLEGQKGLGERFGRGILEGISGTLQGPGFTVLLVVLGNLFAKVVKVVAGAASQLAAVGKAGREQAVNQEGVNRLLSTGNEFYKQRYAAAKSIEQVELVVLSLLKQENAQHQVLATRGANIANVLSAKYGINQKIPGGRFVGAAEGYLPETMQKERIAVRGGVGGASASAQPVSIPNFNFGGGKIGHVVANTNEYVIKRFGGGDGSAIFNPKMIDQIGGVHNLSGLGKVEKIGTGLKRTGIPFVDTGSYQDDYARGFVPNFGAPEFFKALSNLPNLSRGKGKDSRPFFQYGENKDVGVYSRMMLGEGDNVTIHDIEASYGVDKVTGKPLKGKGAGKAFMTELSNLAKLHRVNMSLRAQPFGNEKLNLEELKDFYGKFGFKSIGEERVYKDYPRGTGGIMRAQDMKFYHRQYKPRAEGHIPNFAGLNPLALISHKNLLVAEQAAKELGLKFGGVYPKSNSLTFADPTHGGNIGVKTGSTFASLKSERDWNRIFFNATSKEELAYFRKQRIKLDPEYAKQQSSLTSFAGGFAPGLKEALKRETGAVSASNVYIDADRRLKNQDNPLGLLVANRRDEPSGGFQGIDRALREGKDPTKYGSKNFADGLIPNFAPPLIPGTNPVFNPLVAAGRQFENLSREMQDFLEKKLNTIKFDKIDFTKGQQEIRKALGEAIKQKLGFQVSDLELERTPAGVRFLAAKERLIDRTQDIRKTQIVGEAGKQEGERDRNAVRKAFIAEEENLRATKELQLLRGKLSAGEELDQKDRRSLIRGIRREKESQTDPEFLAFKKRGGEDKILFRQQFNPNIAEEIKNELKAGKANTLNNQIGGFFQQQTGFRSAFRSDATTQKRLEAVLGKPIDQLPLEQQRIVGDNLSSLRKENIGRRQGFGLSAAFALPLLSSTVTSLIGEKAGRDREGNLTPGGKQFRGAVEGVSTGATIAALFPGPAGFAIGGMVGTFITLKSITENLGKSFEQFSKEVDESARKKGEEAERITAAIQSFEGFKEIFSNIRSGESPDVTKRATRQVLQSFQQVPAELKPKFISAIGSGNDQRLLDLQEEVLLKGNTSRRTAEATKRIRANTDEAGVGSFLEGRFLGGDRSSSLKAFDPEESSGVGGFFTRLRNSPGNPLGAFFKDKNFREKLPSLSGESLNEIKDQVNLLPVTAEGAKAGIQAAPRVLKLLEANKISPETGLKLFLRASGLDEEGAARFAESAKGLKFDEIKSVISSKIKNLEENVKANNVTEALSGVVQKAGDFAKVTADILNDLAYKISNANTKVTRQKSLQLQNITGRLDIASPTLTPDAVTNLNFRAKTLQNDLSAQNDIGEAVAKGIEKIKLPSAVLEDKNVSQQIALAIKETAADPNRVNVTLEKLALAVDSFSSKKGTGEKIGIQVRTDSKDIAKEVQDIQAKRQFENEKARLERNLELLRNEKTRQSTFLGGDASKLKNFDLTTFIRGIQSLTQLRSVQTPIINTRFNPVTGQVERGGDLRSERNRSIEQGTKVVNLGKELSQLGLLEPGSSDQDKFRKIAESRNRAASTDLLDRFSETKGVPADIQEIIKNARGRIGPAAKEQADRDFQKTGDDAINELIKTLEKQIEAQDKLNDPLDKNTKAITDNITSLSGLHEGTTSLEKSQTILIQAVDNLAAEMKKTLSPSEKPVQPISDLQALGLANLPKQAPGLSRGFIPSFNALFQEMSAIQRGVGGARTGDVPSFANLRGLGPSVVNSGETIIRNFMDSSKDAVLNRDMKGNFGGSLSLLGTPENVFGGHIPNFAIDDIIRNIPGRLNQSVENNFPSRRNYSQYLNMFNASRRGVGQQYLNPYFDLLAGDELPQLNDLNRFPLLAREGLFKRRRGNRKIPDSESEGAGVAARARILAGKSSKDAFSKFIFKLLNPAIQGNNPIDFNRASGYIPGIENALSREAGALSSRGISNPEQHLFVGKSSGILGVGNTLDEPSGRFNPNFGIQEGIDRYTREGLNPSLAGRTVPNYATDNDSLLTAIDNLVKKLTGIVDSGNENALNKKEITSPNGDEVRHTGRFNVDVSLSGNGNASIDKTIISELQAAIESFKSDINNRLAFVEKNAGQIPSPPELSPGRPRGNVLV